MKTFFKILGLFLIWAVVWTIQILYLSPQGIDHIHNYLLTSIYFLLVIVAFTTVFKKQLDGYVEDFSPKDLLMMVIFSIGVVCTYYFVGILSVGSPLIAIKDSLPMTFQLDNRFLVTKAFDIMFQQTFFMISIYYLFDGNLHKKTNMFLFGLYVMCIHAPLLFVPSISRIFLYASFFAGIIFYYCITKSKKGFLYSYMIHFGFYVILAAFFWLGGAQYISGLI